MSRTPPESLRAVSPAATTPLFADEEWTFPRIDAVTQAIERIAHGEMELDTYPNQLEVISADQMLDAYSSIGLPVYYAHWSFGKQRAIESGQYRRGAMGLAYELVINSNPCISYLMEENTMTMQTLVIAHAAYGHNAFFKNNAFFREWTDADGILDYLLFAQKYLRECEERYGLDAVTDVLDAAHALRNNGVHRAHRPRKLSREIVEKQRLEREHYLQSQLREIWRTIPESKDSGDDPAPKPRFPKEPEENLLYFIEKNAPHLEGWKREILRIVRKIAQYLYPQGQTKIMNEGFACFVHYHILHRLHAQGLLTDGSMMAFYASHTAVVFQPNFNDRRYSGINPYALGFAMFQDIQRICLAPTEEDRRWFPFAGDPDWRKQITFAMREFRDASFVQQYLSPAVIRKLRLFSLLDDAETDHYEVSHIHDDSGYRPIRELLAAQIAQASAAPDVRVLRVDRKGDRSMQLCNMESSTLKADSLHQVLEAMAGLWGYPVTMAAELRA